MGTTDAAFAALVGVSGATMSKWISGDQLPRKAEHVATLCRALDITADQFAALVAADVEAETLRRTMEALADFPPDP